jgi:hypothetical protein
LKGVTKIKLEIKPGRFNVKLTNNILTRRINWAIFYPLPQSEVKFMREIKTGGMKWLKAEIQKRE